MTRRIKLSVVGVAVGLLMALWAIDFSASAHEGHRHAPASAKKLKNPLTATEENIEAGRTLFNRNCASCHGEDGSAKTNVAGAMKVKPADLIGHAMHGITDGEIYWVIANGIKTSGMPAFSAKTRPNEQWQMALYVKHLMGEHPHAAVVSNTSAQAGDKGGEKTVVGYISDSMCGLDHSAMKMGDDKTCTLKCVEGGAKFILADRDQKVVYALDDDVQEKAREFAGQKVMVTGQVDAKAKTIRVSKVEAVG
jgi:mono/diheme cytochrome c family protein